MSSMICPVCRTEYAGWAQRCSNCGVALVAVGDRIDVLALPEEAQVVYELGGWTMDQRGALGELLAENEIPHAWEGEDLIVAEVDEPTVDEFCELVESGEATLDTEEISYELAGWSPPDIDRLEAALAEAEVDAVLEGDNLVIAAKHEATVDAIIDQIAPPGIAAEADEEALAEAPTELLGDLFLAADRLQHNGHDEDGLRRLTAIIDVVDGSSAPFGLTSLQWGAITEQADELADLIADLAEGEAIEEQARMLRATLREFV
jgi:hypothetical protein